MDKAFSNVRPNYVKPGLKLCCLGTAIATNPASIFQQIANAFSLKPKIK